jgi:hypothetical protein
MLKGLGYLMIRRTSHPGLTVMDVYLVT